MASQKNIVVIGASVAGHTFVNTIAPQLPAGYRVILVERNEFIVHLPTVVRSCIVPGWESKNLTSRLTQENVFPTGSRHRVLCPNSVVELRTNSVVLSEAFEGSTELAFEKCIIATGAQQGAPFRPAAGSSLDEYKTFLRNMQNDIKAAESILIVGGGTVGVETGGEINALYPKKQVTIVHSESGLLHPDATAAPAGFTTFPTTGAKVSANLQKQLGVRGVKVYLNDRAILQPGQSGPLGSRQSIPLKSGETVEADYVLVSVGNVPNSAIVKAADPAAVSANGYVIVDSLFRVVPGSSASPLAGEYYALGDVAALPSWRTSVSASAEGPALGNIVAAEIKGKSPKAYTPASMTGACIVTLGDKGGAGQLPMPIFGTVSAPGFILGMKSKDFFARQFDARFTGATKVSTAA